MAVPLQFSVIAEWADAQANFETIQADALGAGNNLADVADPAASMNNLSGVINGAGGSVKIAFGSTSFTGPVGAPISYGVTFNNVPLVIAGNGDADAAGTWVGVGDSTHPPTTTEFTPESGVTGATRINWIAIGN